MADHGTRARYAKHLRDGEKPCKACSRANNEYSRGRDTAAYVRARARALARVAAAHPREYRWHLQRELAKEHGDPPPPEPAPRVIPDGFTARTLGWGPL